MDHLREATALLSFGPFRLNPGRRLLLRVTDAGEEPIALGSRSLDILILLVSCRGTLVRKADLIETVWSGAAVEDNNLTVQMSALRRALGDGQDGARWIETLPGRGYRFVAPVVELAAPVADPPCSEPGPAADHSPPALYRRINRFHAAAGVFVLLMVVIFGLFELDRLGVLPVPDRRPMLSIAVLPFTTDGADPAFDRVAEAITDDLTTKIDAIDGAFVIARETVNALHRPKDSQRTAAELGVRYLLEGSVRPTDALIRVNASLVKADTGATIWSGQFDTASVGPSAGQDAVVNRIAGILGSRMVDSEAQRIAREHPANADASDLLLRARSILNLPQDVRRNEQAAGLLRQSLELDPLSVRAMVLLGTVLVTRQTLVGDQAGRDERTAEARTLLARATQLNPREFGVITLKALLLRWDGDWEGAATAYREALELRPNWSPGYNQMALCALMLGHPEQAVVHLEQALRLDPMASEIHARYSLMGQALLALGRYEEAVGWLRRAIQARPPSPGTYRMALASALALANHPAQAQSELQAALDNEPCVTVSMVRHRLWPSTARAYSNALANGLALAGLRNSAQIEGKVAPPAGRCDRVVGQPRGVTRLATEELQRMVASETKPLLLQRFRSDIAIPGTVWVSSAAIGDEAKSGAMERLRNRVQELTGGDLNRPIVTVAWNVEAAGQQPLAALIASLGYTRVYSYPDGLEAWISDDLPLEAQENVARLTPSTVRE